MIDPHECRTACGHRIGEPYQCLAAAASGWRFSPWHWPRNRAPTRWTRIEPIGRIEPANAFNIFATRRLVVDDGGERDCWRPNDSIRLIGLIRAEGLGRNSARRILRTLRSSRPFVRSAAFVPYPNGMTQPRATAFDVPVCSRNRCMAVGSFGCIAPCVHRTIWIRLVRQFHW